MTQQTGALAAFALVAAVVGFTALLATKSLVVRVAMAMRAGLAVVYFGSYLWLAAHPERRLRWSQVMSGVALVAWPVVWIVPPAVITFRHWRGSKDRTCE